MRLFQKFTLQFRKRKMTFNLIDGSRVDSANVRLLPNGYSFADITTGRDLTLLLYNADKQLFPGFDVVAYNNFLSGTPDPGSASFFGNLTEQLINDPLGAPLAALDSGIKKIFSSSGIQTILVLGVVGFGIYVYLKKAK